jgi:hypothetical protein
LCAGADRATARSVGWFGYIAGHHRTNAWRKRSDAGCSRADARGYRANARRERADARGRRTDTRRRDRFRARADAGLGGGWLTDAAGAGDVAVALGHDRAARLLLWLLL